MKGLEIGEASKVEGGKIMQNATWRKVEGGKCEERQGCARQDARWARLFERPPAERG
jgi:hypothetical protein